MFFRIIRDKYGRKLVKWTWVCMVQNDIKLICTSQSTRQRRCYTVAFNLSSQSLDSWSTDKRKQHLLITKFPFSRFSTALNGVTPRLRSLTTIALIQWRQFTSSSRGTIWLVTCKRFVCHQIIPGKICPDDSLCEETKSEKVTAKFWREISKINIQSRNLHEHKRLLLLT